MSNVLTVRIGTRGSPLALWQAQHAIEQLQKHHPHTTYQLVPITTQGDKTLGPLCQAGGKGLFSKDIHEAMLRGEIDCGVHSLKDVEVVDKTLTPWHSAFCDARIQIAAVWPAGTPVDVLVSKTTSVSVVASDSKRRRDQLIMTHPNVNFVGARGNIETRLKLVTGDVDATILAGAGLERLGLWRGGKLLEPPFDNLRVTPLTNMVPSAGQGVLAIDTLDASIQAHVAVINSKQCAEFRWLERSVLQWLGANCHTSIGLEAGLDGVRWFYKGRQGVYHHHANKADTAHGLYQHLTHITEP